MLGDLQYLYHYGEATLQELLWLYTLALSGPAENKHPLEMVYTLLFLLISLFRDSLTMKPLLAWDFCYF